jgi:hypothetical protein
MADCVNITPTEVRVNLTDYIKHDGYVHHLHELYRTLYQLSGELETKTLRFISVEPEPFRVVAFDQVLEHIARSLSIPRERLILQTYDHYPRFRTPWSTLETRPSTSLDKVFEQVEIDRCIRDGHARMFGGFFGRFTIHRFLMAYFLETEMKDHSVVAFHPPRNWVDYEMESVRKYYTKELEWYYDRVSEKPGLGGFNGRIDDFRSLWDYHNIYSSHHIEVVIETNVYDCGWWTEKTAKCLYTGKPFLLFGTQGQLEELRKLGFKTFAPWIDESYDLEPITDKRFDMIQDEVRRIAALTSDHRQQMIQEINEIADYNKENYARLLKEYQENHDPSH